MDAIFKLDLSPSEKIVALALADHAHDDGTQARPGLASLATKCSLSKRQVQRIIKSLLARGVVVLEKPSTPTHPAWYTFTMSPVDKMSTGYRHPRHLGVTPVSLPVDTGVTLIVKNRSIEEGAQLTILEKSDQPQRLGGLLAKTDLVRSEGE